MSWKTSSLDAQEETEMRLNLVKVFEVNNNRVILGYRGNCF